MDSRHELPPLLHTENVQTSGLESIIVKKIAVQTQEFSISTVLSDWLQLEPSQVTYKLQIEVGAILRKHGCTRIERRKNRIRFWYIPPLAPYVHHTHDIKDGVLIAEIPIHLDEELPQPDYQRRNKRHQGEPLSTENPLQVPGDPIKGAVCAIIILGVVIFVLGASYWIFHEKHTFNNVFAIGNWSQQ